MSVGRSPERIASDTAYRVQEALYDKAKALSIRRREREAVLEKVVWGGNRRLANKIRRQEIRRGNGRTGKSKPSVEEQLVAADLEQMGRRRGRQVIKAALIGSNRIGIGGINRQPYPDSIKVSIAEEAPFIRVARRFRLLGGRAIVVTTSPEIAAPLPPTSELRMVVPVNKGPLKNTPDTVRGSAAVPIVPGPGGGWSPRNNQGDQIEGPTTAIRLPRP